MTVIAVLFWWDCAINCWWFDHMLWWRWC